MILYGLTIILRDLLLYYQLFIILLSSCSRITCSINIGLSVVQTCVFTVFKLSCISKWVTAVACSVYNLNFLNFDNSNGYRQRHASGDGLRSCAGRMYAINYHYYHFATSMPLAHSHTQGRWQRQVVGGYNLPWTTSLNTNPSQFPTPALAVQRYQRLGTWMTRMRMRRH